MKNVVAVWFAAIRPKTLTAAFVPVLVGTILIYTSPFAVNWFLTTMALLAALFIQIGTNLVNDAYDFKKGADKEDRLGPTRVTQAGLLSYQQVLMMGLSCFALAVLFGVPLVIAGGWTIVVIGIVSLLCGYIYTAGPYPLAYVGLGDLFVVIFFGLVAVAGTYFLHSGEVPVPVYVSGLQIGFLSAVLIAINNLRDIEGDTRADKKTLPVRFGKKFARWEISLLLLLPFLLNVYWWQQNLVLPALLSFLTLPLAIKIMMGVWKTEPGRQYNGYLAQSAKLHLFFGLLFCLGILLR